MTIRTVPDTDLQYYLISYDKNGNERGDDPDAPGGQLSAVVRKVLATEPITDVFFMSHGWKGDVPAAIEQYDAWIGAMARCEQDRAAIRALRPDFRPLLVGLHWPSLPWGVEKQIPQGAAFGPGGDNPLATLIDDAAEAIADTEVARAALQTILDAAGEDLTPSQLPPAVVDAYRVLFQEAGLEADGPGGAPGNEGEAFDPERAYQASREDEDDALIDFGGGGFLSGILSPLRQLSFWKMKQRARTFGESGAASLVRQLQQDVLERRDVQFHLMGHSFGCIVVSAAIAGQAGDAPLPRPIDSAFLVQGALSYWAYCDDIPAAPGTPGYFHSIPHGEKVAGPLVTTQSEHDSAVGTLYPVAAGLKRQVDFDPAAPPRYGALGTYGVRGPGVEIRDAKMLDLDQSYDFAPGVVYNLESSRIICEGEGLSGAHSDIAKPEVGHAFWEAVMAASRR